MRADYRIWLTRQKYDGKMISSQLSQANRLERHYGDLDQLFAEDRLEGALATLQYTADDARDRRPNPSKIPIEGDIRNNLASYKNTVRLYRRFLEEQPDGLSDQPEDGLRTAASQPDGFGIEEDLGQRIGLERDMQAALRGAISQLEDGMIIIDDGAERSVNSGFIDITARDSSGAIVVIELKTGPAGQRAVAQILSYMGDISSEEPGAKVRGILVASAFDKKARSAARMVQALSLCTYGVRFSFGREEP